MKHGVCTTNTSHLKIIMLTPAHKIVAKVVSKYHGNMDVLINILQCRGCMHVTIIVNIE